MRSSYPIKMAVQSSSSDHRSREITSPAVRSFVLVAGLVVVFAALAGMLDLDFLSLLAACSIFSIFCLYNQMMDDSQVKCQLKLSYCLFVRSLVGLHWFNCLLLEIHVWISFPQELFAPNLYLRDSLVFVTEGKTRNSEHYARSVYYLTSYLAIWILVAVISGLGRFIDS